MGYTPINGPVFAAAMAGAEMGMGVGSPDPRSDLEHRRAEVRRARERRALRARRTPEPRVQRSRIHCDRADGTDRREGTDRSGVLRGGTVCGFFSTPNTSPGSVTCLAWDQK